MDIIIGLLKLFILLPVGLLLGGRTERKHLKALDQFSEENADIIITDLKTFPGVIHAEIPPKMFIGEVTIGSDYYKTFAAKLRNFFGGEMKSFETLQIRARREAIKRIVIQAKAEGYNTICNMRMETADIGGSATARKGMVTVTILASATAYVRG